MWLWRYWDIYGNLNETGDIYVSSICPYFFEENIAFGIISSKFDTSEKKSNVKAFYMPKCPCINHLEIQIKMKMVTNKFEKPADQVWGSYTCTNNKAVTALFFSCLLNQMFSSSHHSEIRKVLCYINLTLTYHT